MTITVQNAKAQPIPDPSPTDISNCRIFLGAGKSIPINTISEDKKPTKITNFFVTGDRQYKIEFTNPIPVTFNGRTSIAYQITYQNISTTPTPAGDYLWIYPELEFNDTPNRQLTKIGTMNIIYKSNEDGQWKPSNITESTADPSTLRLFGRYVKWLNDNNGKAGCVAKSADPSSDESYYMANSILSNGKYKTTSIHKLKSDNTIDSTFYLVAHGNYTSPLLDATGFIYRSGSSYILVNKQGTILQTFTTGTDYDWKKGDNIVSNFNEPVPTVDRSETANHFKLPSDSGRKIVVKFSPALKDGEGGDVAGIEKDVTIEANLDDPKGPFINKVPLGLSDLVSGIYESSRSDTGFGADMFILELKDLDALYDVASNVPSQHKSALVSKLIICAHRKLNNNNGYTSGFETLILDSNNNGIWEEGGNITKIADQGAGVSDWTFADGASPNPLLIINAKKGVQTCGGSDDKTLATQLKDGAGSLAVNSADAILKAIQAALEAVAKIIQNFIVYVVSWAIGLASRNIPI